MPLLDMLTLLCRTAPPAPAAAKSTCTKPHASSKKRARELVLDKEQGMHAAVLKAHKPIAVHVEPNCRDEFRFTDFEIPEDTAAGHATVEHAVSTRDVIQLQAYQCVVIP